MVLIEDPEKFYESESLFAEPPPEWVLNGRFFDRARYRDRSVQPVGYTGNLMIAGTVLVESGLRFDERFNETGGEDTHLTFRLHQRGCRIVWADDAIVRETVAASCVNATYLIARSYRQSRVQARIHLELEGPISAVPRYLAASAIRFGKGLALLAISIFGPKYLRISALQLLAAGAGRMVTLLRFGA